MNNTSFMILVIVCFLTFVLSIFSLFAIGFLIGYKAEDLREKRKIQFNNKQSEESIEEKKAKKEWKSFLEYDGSAPETNI